MELLPGATVDGVVAEGAAMDGFHVEGPHISPDDGPRGAHPLRWVRPPDLDEFRRWQDATGNQVRIVTLAPEWCIVGELPRLRSPQRSQWLKRVGSGEQPYLI